MTDLYVRILETRGKVLVSLGLGYVVEARDLAQAEKIKELCEGAYEKGRESMQADLRNLIGAKGFNDD